MIREPIAKKWTTALGVLSIAVLLGAYTLISHVQHVKNPSDTTIPTWGQLAEGARRIVAVNEGEGRWLTVDAAATGKRLFLGLFFGVSGAVLAGILMGCFPVVEAALLPPLSLLAKLPPTAALAVFFVLVGTDTEMFTAMIAFGVLPTLAQSIFLSVREVPDELIFKSYTLGASHCEVIWNVIARIVLPRLIDAVRLQIGPAMVYLIAAEMVCGDAGFGYRIRLQSRLLNMNVVYPYLAILSVFGLAADCALRFTQRAVCPWYAEERT